VVGFVIKRLAWGCVLVVLVTMITFFIFFILPPNQPGSNPQAVESGNLETQYNLEHKSIPAQYVTFLNHLAHGNLGESIRYNVAVTDQLKNAAPVTLSLLLGGTILWLLIAFPIGILSALYPRSMLDKGLMAFVLIGISAHPVWWGLIFSYLGGYKLHIFPIAGYCDLVYQKNDSINQCGGPKYWAYHMVLPWFTFALLFAAFYARMIRATLLETMEEDYVRTARAKGVSENRIMWVHVLRNASIPIITYLMASLPGLLLGHFLIERFFSIPGIGREVILAVERSDFPVIKAITVYVAFATIATNLLADLTYKAVDPRVQLK
jgi:peptide/nickel transport system permease protein